MIGATHPLQCKKKRQDCSRRLGVSNLFPCHHCLNICLRTGYSFYVKSFNQDFGNIGREKRRKRGAETEIFKSQMQQGKQYCHGLLLIPRNIERDRQIIDIFYSENFFEFQCDHSKGVAIVALSGIPSKHPEKNVAAADLFRFFPFDKTLNRIYITHETCLNGSGIEVLSP